jgi:FAD/FMN-containing dehydrogenase
VQWASAAAGDYTFTQAPSIRVIAAILRWDAAFIKARAPEAIRSDDRPGAAADNVFWSANLSEAGHFIHGFESVWLPASLLRAGQRHKVTDALLAAARHSTVELHFQKGLAGGAEAAIAATRDTSTNPAVINAFALAIIASEGPPAFPGLAGHEPDLAGARKSARDVGNAMDELKKVAPHGGSYVAESNFFEHDWQRSYWGPNYARLRGIKRKYDPAGLFFVHHGLGSEEWSADGFTRLA